MKKKLTLFNLFIRNVPDRPEIIEVRNALLQRILIFCLLPGIFVVIPGIYQTWNQGRWGYSVFYLCSYLVFLISLFFVKQKSYRYSGEVLVVILFCLSLVVLSRLGLSGIGIELMIVACFASSVLLNIKRSLLLICLGILSIALISYGMVTDLLVIYDAHMMTSRSFLSWLTAGVIFSLVTLLMIITPQMFLIRLEESLESAQQKAEHLALSNELLFKEMSKRIQSEEEKRQLQLTLRNIIDFMPSIIIGIDREFRITHWNKEAELATGCLSKVALGDELSRVFPQFEEQLESLRTAIIEAKIQKESKWVMNLRNGTRFMDLLIYPVQNSNMTCAVIRLDDITARVQMEENLIQNDKLAAIGGLTAGIAHEINNPLSVILQGVQMINNRFSMGIKKNQEVASELGVDLEKVTAYMQVRKITNYIEGIQEAGYRSAEIIGNMLQFSRKSETRMSTVSVQQLIDKVLVFAGNDFDLKKKYDFKNVRIIKDYDLLLENICCNETEIEQVLLNIIKNATQALSSSQSADQPQIIIRTRKEETMALIEIEDNGPGMDHEVARRIFEPFFTTKEVAQGTGLGLSVSYMIINNNHSGTLEVNSTPGQGSVFSIRLPN